MVTGAIETHLADAVILGTGGYGNVFYLSTNAKGSNATAIWRAYKRGAAFANPCFTQIHPTCIPVSGEHQSKLTLMSESLRNDGRVWVPKRKEDCAKPPNEIPEADRDYYLERKYPSFGNLSPRDIASRAAKEVCDEGRGVGPGGRGVYLDFADAIKRLGKEKIAERYGNLFEMYERITDENPYEVPMRIYPAVHYTMGGLWVDYNLMSTIPGLHVIGEANFSDHGANRLGASALMQGLADGYFVVPLTIGDYLGSNKLEPVTRGRPGGAGDGGRRARAHGAAARRSRASARSTSFHRELGKIDVGVLRHGAQRRRAHERRSSSFPKLREEFWRDVRVPGTGAELNQSLEQAGRVADFLELARADVPRRAASRGVVRRPLPRRASDAGRRSAARRRAVRVRRRRGSTPATGRRRCSTRSRSCSRTSRCRSGATSEGTTMNLTLHVWRQAGPNAPGKLERYEARDVSPDMSFLEMLDVVNEGLDRERRRADRVRSRLPRGHLRLVRHDDQRRRARSDEAARRPASCTCAASRTATTIYIEPWRRARSR